MWGVDILGQFNKGKGGVQFLIVAIDYFTKWVEARPLARINEQAVEKFVRDDVIFCYSVPKVLVTDNGQQFDNLKVRHFCSNFNIDFRNTAVAHPQSNARTPTGETPFRLVYGTEALTPVEVTQASFRLAVFEASQNEAGLQANADFIDEVQEEALLRNETYKQKFRQYHNRRVKSRGFIVGDLVLRKAATADPRSEGKLSTNWEGPYIVSKVVRPGTYHLQTQGGTTIPREWNVENFKKIYQ
ncbi:uncharacterized protein LOC122074201 [Macadamia integrifolia]|uniref:uncharacterized protein LOC122074201 n=1 Tax=Macadamia integrifolia TaxID=60698 RepID=UPI001C500A57|nr:uncharacterized protein LOC122074201 [Macadamia integrifolia]